MEYYYINKLLHTTHFNNFNEIKSLTSTPYFNSMAKEENIFPLFSWKYLNVIGNFILNDYNHKPRLLWI